MGEGAAPVFDGVAAAVFGCPGAAVVTPAGAVVIVYEVRERLGQLSDEVFVGEACGDDGTYERLADGTGSLKSSVDIRLSCTGTCDAVENVLDKIVVCAEAFCVGC